MTLVISPLTVAIASDHAGRQLKDRIVTELSEHCTVFDLGTDSDDSVDYPDFAYAVAGMIGRGEAMMGVLICGSGIGMSIGANRHPDIRAALCHNEETARLSRQHNDANVLCLGQRILDEETALTCVRTFFDTPFEGGRHQRRVDKLTQPGS